MANSKRFKLADIMPNAWFYKLKDMGKTKKTKGTATKNTSKTNTKTSKMTDTERSFPVITNPHRQSYHFSPETRYMNNIDKLYNSPIKPKIPDIRFLDQGARKLPRRRKRSVNRSSPRAALIGSSSVSTSPLSSPVEVEETKGHNGLDDLVGGVSSWSRADDIIINIDNSSGHGRAVFDQFHDVELAPIQTKKPVEVGLIEIKPIKRFNDVIRRNETTDQQQQHVKGKRSLMESTRNVNASRNVAKEQKVLITPGRRSLVGGSIGGIKIKAKVNSPRLVNGRRSASNKNLGSRAQAELRKIGTSDAHAIVKNSSDPEQDFRNSMLEMIVEHHIVTAKKLEDLLALFLTLNNFEWHDLIVKVFEQIWFDLHDIRRTY